MNRESVREEVQAEKVEPKPGERKSRPCWHHLNSGMELAGSPHSTLVFLVF